MCTELGLVWFLADVGMGFFLKKVNAKCVWISFGKHEYRIYFLTEKHDLFLKFELHSYCYLLKKKKITDNGRVFEDSLSSVLLMRFFLPNNKTKQEKKKKKNAEMVRNMIHRSCRTRLMLSCYSLQYTSITCKLYRDLINQWIILLLCHPYKYVQLFISKYYVACSSCT